MSSSTNWNQRDEFFNYTRTRFISNESHELSQRRVDFNMNELARLSAEAVGAKSCLNIEKYPDGMFSKAFLMTMEDGKQVVAKVLNPNAGRPHFTTASEVATVDFVRNVCGTSVPKVFAWHSRAEANPVGAEYIIMERLAGVQLSTVWRTLPFEMKAELVKALGSYQKAWISITFQQYGSLYYAKDLPKQLDQPTFSYVDKNGVEIEDRRFAIGPVIHRQSVDYGRALVDFDRGPWNNVAEYCMAIGDREIACVRAIQPLPKPPLTLVGQYVPTRAKKLAALQCYMTLVKYLLPIDLSITTSHLWHLDLHHENIFVDPDQPSRIVGIIDCQSVGLAPLFENALQPALLDYEGPPLDGIERPEYPTNFEQLDPTEQALASKNY